MSMSGNKYLDEYLEIREKVILPALEDLRSKFETDGWYCFVGDLDPFKEMRNTKKQMPERYGFTSISIMDIENGIVQYVFVFLEDGRVRITCDVLKEDTSVSLDLGGVSRQSVEETIKKLINL